jgi:hypothetical protein
MPPPLAVTVMVSVPAGVLLLTVMVMVEVPAPGAGIEDGLNDTEIPDGKAEVVKAIAELKPPVILVVTVEVPELPRTMVTAVGDTLRPKPGVLPVTVSETVVVSVMLPEVPVTVMG